MTKGIPTMYAGVQFRSRLEARWAAFFDLVGWRWEYEPIDLDGYIPDFILQLDTPLLVEVKPLVDDAGFRQPIGTIERSGWKGAAAVVGAARFNGCAGMIAHGVGFGELPDGYDVWTRPYGTEGLIPIGCLTFPFDDISCVGSSGESFCGGYMGQVESAGRIAISCGELKGGRRGPIWRKFGIHSSADGFCIAEGHVDDSTALWREAGNRVQWRAPELGR